MFISPTTFNEDNNVDAPEKVKLVVKLFKLSLFYHPLLVPNSDVV